MPVITMPSGVAAVTIEGPYVEINGRSAPDVILRMAELTTGLMPTRAQVAFPNLGPFDSPVRLGDVVKVWLNRWGSDFPIFIGRVRGTPWNLDAQEGRICGGDALSLAADLMDGVCSRDFNQVDETTGQPLEVLGLREIVTRIFEEYEAYQEAQYDLADRPSTERIRLDIASFPPNGEVGEYMAKGVPHGQALEELVHTFGDGTWRTKVEYTQGGSAVLRCYQIGQGLTYYLVSPTDSNAHPSAQPDGRANVNEAYELEDNTGTENIIELEGARRLFEQAVPLTPEFDVRLLDTYTARAEAAAAGAALGRAGAEDPALEAFGRQWRLPTYLTDLDGSARTLELDRELLQAEEGGEAWGDRPRGPAVVYRLGSTNDPLVILTGSNANKTGATTLTIPGEEEGSTRHVGKGIRVDGEHVVITAQNGGTLTGDFSGVDGGGNPHDWTIFDGYLDTWRVMQGGVRVEGNVVTLNKPLVEKATTERTVDLPVWLGKAWILSYNNGVRTWFTHVVYRNENPFDAGFLSDWADGSEEVYAYANGYGDPLVPVDGEPTSLSMMADEDFNGDPDRTKVYIDAAAGYIYRAMPIPRLTSAVDKQDQLALWVVSGKIPEFLTKAAVNGEFVHLRKTVAVGEWAVPDQVWLEGTWKSKVPFVATSDPQGTDALRITRRRAADGFVYKAKKAPWFELEADGAWSPGTTVTATLEEGDDVVIRDDTALMKATANRMAKVAAEPAKTFTRKLPLMPTGMKVGMQLRENGVPLGANIRTVRWDFIEAVTYIEAMTH